MKTDRQIIRDDAVGRRKSLPPGELHRLGDAISRQVFNTTWFREASAVHCFFGVVEKGEVSTRKLLEGILSEGKTLVMPRMEGEEGRMGHYIVQDLNRLEINSRGIPEPADCPAASVRDIDLVLVPGLAADRAGNRIGFGKGYYDRFLSQQELTASSILLLPEVFLVETVPAEPHDVPVDAIATDTRLIDCHGYRNF
ncbi:5-formyltetrahydrofolate cyclo-ligase [Balneolales bacterium ANBcel1]|nr:5-formyltetrahydrofolate cyclo-ligase [Balneolales bacterium ANBcel1]